MRASPLRLFLVSVSLALGCDGGKAATTDAGGDEPTADGSAADRGMTADAASPPPPDGAAPAPDSAAAVDTTAPPAPDDAATGLDTAAPGPDAPPATNPVPGAYGSRKTLPASNSEFALTSVGSKVYVLGGYPSSRQPQSTLQIYDTKTDTWSLGMPYPTTIHHPVTAGVGDKLYSLGGQVSLAGASDTARSFEYDPATNMWRPLASMRVARGGGAAAVIDDKIYVVGGRPPAANAFEVYDVSDDRWTDLPPLPARFNNRNHIIAGAMGGKVYVAGGRYNGGGFGDPRTDALEMFDPAAGTWTAKKPMLRARGGMSGVVANGCFFVYGGEGQGIGEPNDVYPDHDVYNPVTDTWTALPKLPVPFHGVTGGAFVDGIIYMPGGGTSSGGSSGANMHQVYRPAMRCD